MTPTTEETLQVRRGTREDIDLLLAWRKAMMLDMQVNDAATIDAALPAFRAWIWERLEKPEELLAAIGEVDGTPVACAIAWIHPWFPGLADQGQHRGYLLNVYTDPAWRQRGFAGQVVQACQAWFCERGIRVVALHASVQGQSVYAKLDFKAPGMPEMVWVAPK